LKKFASNFADR